MKNSRGNIKVPVNDVFEFCTKQVKKEFLPYPFAFSQCSRMYWRWRD